jgi:DNA helicase II / ATP-dependent DNA helicase PcrA
MRPYLAAAEELRSNPDQWAAYQSEQHCVILAGPGSGKTKVLAVKLARIYAEDLRAPQSMVCLTYNNLCVRELRRRLEALGVEARRGVFVGTVHSFCLQQIIRPYAHLTSLNLPHPLKIATDAQKQIALARAVKTVRPSENPTFWSRDISLFRQHYIYPASRDAAVDRDVALMAMRYEAELANAAAIDFEGIVIAAARLVSEHEWIRKALRSRFPILAVDEYQDLGVPLHELVATLCFSGGVRLLAVGDPDQSIYGFTGAKPELLRSLAARPDVQRIDLRVNYRSAAVIVQASQAALRQKRAFTPSAAHTGGIFFHTVPAGLEAQANLIMRDLLPVIETKGVPTGEVAILYRDQNDGAVIAGAARRAGLKYIRTDAGSPYPRSPLIMWLEDCALWCAGGWREGVPRLTAITSQFTRLADVSREDRQREARRTLIRFLYQQRDTPERVHSWLADVRREVLDNHLDFEERPEDAAGLQRLEHATAPGAVLHEMTVRSFGQQRGAPDHLNLTTLFSCKGSEFDVVIIPGLEQGRTPKYDATTAAALEEERRLFYVGLTRARKEVHLLSSGWYIGGNRRRDNGPSQFIGEVRMAVEEFNAGQDAWSE